jgi:branched-chain amino acid transport system ATP-binding protein
MLEIRDLEVRYGQAIALDGLDLDVGNQEIICVVGPNGAGKSTLVNTIAGIERPVRGTIRMDGNDISRTAGHRVCDYGISIVPEGRRLFPKMTVLENLELGAYRRACRPTKDERLEFVCELFPRLRDRLRQPAGTLSGGEQQMCAIGRALMAQPRLLLLDEPSLGLAPIVVDELFEVIASIHRSGVAVLLVEQRVDQALALAERGYILVEGRILRSGTSETLLADAEVQSAILGLH